MLEHRFRLAFDLCRCIHTFHKVGWLHRNLHSMNVLFFPHEATSNADWAKDPRILGFARSRQTWIDAFTDGPNDIDQRWKYQHPKYLVEGERYREEFDYYSVGMLLLEIGLWSTLSKLTDSDRFKNLSHEEFRREVLATRIPQLGIAMGGRYMQAARMCLEGGFSTRSDDSRGEEDIWSASFEIRVMNQIPLID